MSDEQNPSTGPAKRIRPGAEHKTVPLERTDYVTWAGIKMAMDVTRAIIALSTLLLIVGLGLIVARGMGYLPDLTDTLMKGIVEGTFGDGVLLLLVSLLKTITNSNEGKKK